MVLRDDTNEAERILNTALGLKRVIDEHISNDEDAWRLGNYIPNSWVDDNGVRHAVVWSVGEDARIRIIKQADDWAMVEEPPF